MYMCVCVYIYIYVYIYIVFTELASQFLHADEGDLSFKVLEFCLIS